MNNLDASMVKRSILLGAKIRFSPSGASVRNQAIERIIEQNLASAEAANGLTEQELQNLMMLGGQVSVLRTSDVRHGLESLRRSQRVLESIEGKKRRYTLSDAARNEITQIVKEAEARTTATVRELFGKAPGGDESYQQAFLRLLCKVYSKLSDVYIEVITGKQSAMDPIEHKLLSDTLEQALKSEQVPDAEAFRYGVTRFFRESTPQFDLIKWNMTQNFYVVRALGLDASSDLLSSEVFKDASLYCDTNILIAGLTPDGRHHGSFQEMARGCKTIGMCLKATHFTLDELRSVICYHASLLRKVIDRIPHDMQPKVRDFLLDAYQAQKETSPDLSLDSFIECFQKPPQTLRESFGLVEEDDQWFDIARVERETKKLADSLSQQYKKMRGRPKPEGAAIHDAVLVLWVRRENTNGRKSWL